jgi:2'-5' RNA ligase
MQPLILTLHLDADSFEHLDALRRAHFPVHRNHLSAHLTLFHKLPAEKENFVREKLEELATRTTAMPLQFAKPRFLGKGVAIEVESAPLVALRHQLSDAFKDFLSPQDAQTIRPHVTIQNKVTPEVARDLFEKTSAEWEPWSGRGEGLLLWRYLGGPWELEREFKFQEQ